MKRPKGLPDWFNLENYHDVSSLSPKDWYENLHKRRMFFTWTSITQKIWPESQVWRVADAKNRIEIIIKMITENPLIRVQPDKKIYHSRNTVKSLSNRDVVNNYQALIRDAPEVFFQYLNLEKQSHDDAHTMSYRNDELKTFMEADCRPWGYAQAVLSVDLHVTDEHIIQDFKNWLSNTRNTLAKASAKRTFSSLDFEEWGEYKILPYLDLKIWSIYSGSKITQAMIGNAIFPNELDVDTTERIRKTTKKKAEWLMNHSVVDALGVQLKKEIEENKTE